MSMSYTGNVDVSCPGCGTIHNELVDLYMDNFDGEEDRIIYCYECDSSFVINVRASINIDVKVFKLQEVR